jgi:hypothetical protein
MSAEKFQVWDTTGAFDRTELFMHVFTYAFTEMKFFFSSSDVSHSERARSVVQGT